MLERIVLKDGRLRPILRVFVYTIGVLFVWLLVAVTIGNVFALFKGPAAAFIETPGWIIYVALDVSTIGVAVLLRTSLDRRSVDSLGLTLRTCWLRLLLLGIALGAGMQLLIFAVELVAGVTQVAGISLTGKSLGDLAGLAALLFAAAIAEEMPLRGYTLQNLWEEAGFWPAAIATSLLFAFIHIGNPHFGDHPWITAVNIAADGMWACVSVLWTRSLWLAWGQHFAWNLFEGPILGAPVSGNSFPSVVVQNTGAATISSQGPLSVLTGGAFGPEGGLISLLALVVGLATLFWLYRGGAFSQLPDTREAYAGGRISSTAT